VVSAHLDDRIDRSNVKDRGTDRDQDGVGDEHRHLDQVEVARRRVDDAPLPAVPADVIDDLGDGPGV
jgi:hypothetical protein